MKLVLHTGILFTLIGLVGCSSGRTPELTTVEGVILLNGKPASNLLIQFNPTEWPQDTPMLTFSALSDNTGKYKVLCSNGKPGAAVGKYKVTVVDNNLATDQEPVPGKRGPKNRLPNLYASPTTSTIDVTVEPSKQNYELTVMGGR